MHRLVGRESAELLERDARLEGRGPFALVLGSSPSPFGVFVVQPTRVYRDAIVRLLREANAVVVVGAAASADEALPRIERIRPELVVLDAVAHGPDDVRALRGRSPDSAIIAIALLETEDVVDRWLAAGLLAYVPSEGSAADLLAIVDGLARRRTASPQTPAQAEASEARVGVATLTLRDEIADLLARGFSNKQIARRLSIQVQTVKNHVSHVFEKLGVRTRSELAGRLRRPPNGSDRTAY